VVVVEVVVPSVLTWVDRASNSARAEGESDREEEEELVEGGEEEEEGLERLKSVWARRLIDSSWGRGR
jgi:hypothetical protein